MTLRTAISGLVSSCLLLSASSGVDAKTLTPDQAKAEARRRAKSRPVPSQILSSPRSQVMSGMELPLNPRFKEVKRLADEQKLNDALQLATKILAEARAEKNDRLLTESLILVTQLQIGLHGYETAVQTLRKEIWPSGETERLLLHLYYGGALLTYQRSYSYEIVKREKTGEVAEVDLRAWTRVQIGSEILRSFDEALKFQKVLAGPVPDFYKVFLSTNTYPEAVRPTLRDAVVYLAAEQLSDSSFWTAAQTNGVYQLPVADLAQGRGAPGKLVLADSSVHPLVRLTSLLNAHHDFHASRPAAALESRYELLRRLNVAVTGTRDHQTLREALQTLQKSNSSLEWWSVGQALLSQFFQAENERPDRMIVALQAAKEGADRHPKSYGAQLCNSIVDQILRPSLAMTMMAADGFRKESVQLSYQHVGALNFRAYAWDIESRIAKVPSQEIWQTRGELGIDEIIAGKFGAPVASWTQELPATTDHLEHSFFVTPPLTKPGAYLILASVRPEFLRDKNMRASGHMIIGDMVLERVTQKGGDLEVRALRGDTGAPLSGVSISSYLFSYNSPAKLVATRTTDAEGRVKFTSQDPGTASGSVFQVATRKEGAVTQLALFEDGAWLTSESADSTKYMDAFLFTDRSVFRPEQKILWKTLLYQGNSREGKFEVAKSFEAEVVLFDANSQEVAKQKVMTNEFGTAAGEFKIPAGRALGEWRLQTRLASSHQNANPKIIQWRGYNSASVTVEEYKRPTFEASFPEGTAALRLNQKASLKGEARYYFGLPVASGTVAWRVTKTPVWPWWSWGGYGRGFGRSSMANPEVVAAGASGIAKDGSFNIDFTPQADEREAAKNPGLSFRFDLEATVTDEGGESREAKKTIQLGFVSRTAEIKPTAGFFREGQPIEAVLRLTNLSGEGLAGAGHWRVVKVQQPEKTLLPAELPPEKSDTPKVFETAGDKKRPRWETDFSVEALTQSWPDGAEQAKGDVTHDPQGAATLNLKAGLPTGVFRFIYEGKDDFGASFRVSREVIVVDKNVASKEAGGTNIAVPLLALVEKSSFEVGETARVFIQSGFKDQPLLVDIYRAGQLIKRQASLGKLLLEIPVTEADRGGFSVLVRSLRDYQYFQTSVPIFVPWTNQELKIAYSSFRDKIRPGTQEKFRVTVSSAASGSDANHAAKPLPKAAAEVLAYMYDRSLDLFRAHQPPSPLSLFPSRLGAATPSSNLGVVSAYVSQSSYWTIRSSPVLQIDQLRFPNSYGVGGPGRRGGFGRGGIGMMMAKSARSDGAEMQSLAAAPSADASSGSLAGESKRENVSAAGQAPPPPPTAAVPLRANFSETAFWQPQLLTGADGSVAIEFTVPDSLTSWNVWVHAITKDLRAGSLKSETRSVKDLMVRPQVPRFFREGDEADLRVSVNNASAQELSGVVTLEIEDPDTGKSAASDFGLTSKDLSQPFKAAKSGSETLTFKIKAPRNVHSYAFKLVAKSNELSDGERRLVPVLPSRLHLAQSRFVTLKENQTKTMEFKDLAANTDKSLINDRMVVTVDAQLFYGVLKSLPYLITYPYECTEQTLNRFLSTGIVSSVFKKYPSVEKMAQDFAKRETQFEKFDGTDPNQRMTFEESPWLEDAKGGEQKGLINVLDPKIAASQRDMALAKLKKMQLPGGGFPWFEGGPANEYMTLYLLIGFARAQEFKVDVPKEMIAQAWVYLKSWRETSLRECMAHDGCESLVTMLGFALSSYPDLTWTANQFTEADKKELLDYSFRHWKTHSPLLKGYLAMTLHRAKRDADAKLVWASVMDSAKSSEELGTFWAPEERSWLWYNDTIETHAFALRTQMELAPKDFKNEGLVQWLFLNKKLNHWKSTRATAESIYSLVHYLDKNAALGKREEVSVETSGQTKTFVFEPESYTGAKNQIVIPGAQMTPAASSKVIVKKSGPGFAFASSTWHFSTEQLPLKGDGDFFSVSRRYFKRELQNKEWVLKALKEGDRVKVGDQVEVQLSLKTKHEAEYVHLRDPRGAGFEPESQVSGYHFDLGLAYYEEIRDSGSNFFFNWLPVGEYTFKYRIRANMGGTFRVGPATVQSLYAPEFNAYSEGQVLRIEP